MSRSVILLLALLVAAPAARAGGVNFAWGDCFTTGASIYKHFACDTNVSSPVAVAVASFQLAYHQPSFVGIEGIVDLLSNSATMPDWWQLFNPGSCRQTALTVSADFRFFPDGPCVDPWGGLALGGIAGYQTMTTIPADPLYAPNYTRLKVAFALVDAAPLSADTEYYAFAVRIDGTRTVGAGACGGCDVPVCLGLSEIKAAENTGPYERLVTPIQNQFIGWQCAQTTPGLVRVGANIWNVPVACAPPGIPCATPARNRTWGSIKALYR